MLFARSTDILAGIPSSVLFSESSHTESRNSRVVYPVAVELFPISLCLSKRKRALIYGAVYASTVTLKGDFLFRWIKLEETKRRRNNITRVQTQVVKSFVARCFLGKLDVVIINTRDPSMALLPPFITSMRDSDESKEINRK